MSAEMSWVRDVGGGQRDMSDGQCGVP